MLNLSNSTNRSMGNERCSVLIFSNEKISTDSNVKLAVDLFVVISNTITCPCVILLNILVMVAVKTKQQLRTNSNTALACLATTDLLVGITIQPLYITMTIGFMKEVGSPLVCNTGKATRMLFAILINSSLNLLTLVSGERYFAINHPYLYQTSVTKRRIIAAALLAWSLPLIEALVLLVGLDSGKPNLIFTLFVTFPRLAGIIFIIYCHAAVYGEVHRHEKQIIQQQISVEAKEKMSKEKKALKTTTFIIGAVIVCYMPLGIVIALNNFQYIPSDIKYSLISVTITVVILNSLFNPLIYTARNRQFRVAFIQMLTRKSAQKAEEIEMRYFGSPNVIAIPEPRQER